QHLAACGEHALAFQRDVQARRRAAGRGQGVVVLVEEVRGGNGLLRDQPAFLEILLDDRCRRGASDGKCGAGERVYRACNHGALLELTMGKYSHILGTIFPFTGACQARSDMNENNVTQALTAAAERMLKPLVRVLLRNGIAYRAFADIARQVYV